MGSKTKFCRGLFLVCGQPKDQGSSFLLMHAPLNHSLALLAQSLYDMVSIPVPSKNQGSKNLAQKMLLSHTHGRQADK